MMIFQSLVVTIADADPGPDYDLLIITPLEFHDELIPLKQFKDATCRPTEIVTLEYIYSHYTGADKAEQVKKCIADYETTHNIKYVMLIGDVDKLPIRYFLVQTNNDTGSKIDWFAYYMTDHYYADLYDSSGAFCSWNADGDAYYAETVRTWPSFTFTNVDGVDYEFDVIVSRLPASTGTEVANYVNRVIEYETEVSTTDAWFKKIMLVTGSPGSIYPEDPEPGDPVPYWDIQQLNSLGARLTPFGFSEIQLYHENSPTGSYYPNVVNVNTHLNSGAGLFTILSHQNRQSFGFYNFPGDMAGLANDGKYPVMFSLGCSPAQIGPIAPNQNYLDTTGAPQNYGYSYPVPYSSWTTPNPPNVLQTTTDVAAIPEDVLCYHNDKGAIAFIGSMAEASGTIGYPASNYYHQSIADGERILGEIWRDVSTGIMSHNNPANHWERSRRWMFLNLFGDPTLNIGGLPDKPPVTSLSIGSPKYIAGDTTYVKSSTTFTLTATDDVGIATTCYQYYPVTTPGSTWSTGTSFTISGDDGEYIIWYYSIDSAGNIDYPIKSQLVTLDNSAPTTTLSIGTPKHTAGADIYINSNTLITLTATDGSLGSGIEYIEYRIDAGSWTPYSTAFQVYGTDGSHTIYYRSKDNLGTTESTKNQVIILDNTPPEITLTIGSPKYGTTPLWVTSDTLFTISITDSGVGPNYIQYSLDSVSPYNTAYVTYTAPFTLPGTESDIGRHVTINMAAYDLLNNMNSASQSVIVDNKPPESWESFGEPYYYDSGSATLYITSSTEFTFNPMDWEDYGSAVGVDYTKYRIDSGAWCDFTGVPITFSGDDGVHTMDYYSVDHLGNTEATKSRVVFLDNTPPEVNIELPGDGAYVYGLIPIVISATDEGSGVHHVDYSLDGGATWLPATYDTVKDRWIGLWDTTLFTEGTHTLSARAEDNVGNIGYDDTPPTVTIVYLDYEIEFSDSDWNYIQDFNVVFSEQKPGEYRVSTNPGTIYEIITITNTGTLVTLPEIILDVMIPLETDFLGPGQEAFKFLGAKSVHVYLNGVDVTPPGKWLPSLHNVDVNQALAPGDTIEIYLHYEYAFKGRKYTDPDVSSWPGEDYVFETDILSAYGPSWTNTLSALPIKA